MLEEEHLRMPEGEVFLLGIVWWNTASKSFHGMECQNLLPYTCDVKGAQNDITMSWDGKQFVIDEIETSNIWKEIDLARGLVRHHFPHSFVQTGEYGDPGGPRKRLFTIHATRITTVRSGNGIHAINSGYQSASSAATPALGLQGLEKALAGNWSTSYEFAPGGISSNRRHGPARRRLANRARWIRSDGRRACTQPLWRNVSYRVSLVG